MSLQSGLDLWLFKTLGPTLTVSMDLLLKVYYAQNNQ